MTLRSGLLGASAAAALSLLACSAASAGNVSGTIDATYGHGSNGIDSIWSADGALAFDTGWHSIGIEGNVGYAHADGTGGHQPHLVDWRGRTGYATSTPLMPVAWMSPTLSEPTLSF